MLERFETIGLLVDRKLKQLERFSNIELEGLVRFGVKGGGRVPTYALC